MIEHKGAVVVPEINLGHGHCGQAINGGRILKRKITNRQRKHLLAMGPVHEDEWAALNDLLRIGRGDIDTQLDVEEIAQTIFEENAALNEIKDVDLDNEDDSVDEGDVSEASIA